MIRYTLLLTTIFILSNSLLAQNFKISGKIIDEEKKPIELAEVLLLTQDSILLKSQLSDKEGFFSLDTNPDDYILQIKYLSEIVYDQKLNVQNNLDLGHLNVYRTQQLAGVVVEGKKKLIERKVDRLIVNIENSIAGSGGNALDALKIIPGVRINNNEISIVGKDGMSVMIDDKLILLNGEDLINFLRTISSDNIKSIEVITTPPAKYDAEGNNGILNIKLKKALPNSWSNTVSSSYQQGTYPSFRIGDSFVYQKDKLSLLFDISGNKGNSIYTNDTSYDYPKQHWDNNTYNKTNYKIFGSTINIGYNLSKTSNIGVQYMARAAKGHTKENNSSNISNRSNYTLEQILKSNGYNNENNHNHSINLNFLQKLDTLGKKFTVDVDYLRFKKQVNNTLSSENRNILLSNNIVGSIKNKSYQKIDNFSARIDFEMPYKWANISYGSKLSFTKSNNITDISRHDNNLNTVIFILNEYDNFKYNENISALYFSAKRKFGEKWEGKVGLRSEFTYTKGYSRNENAVDKNNYIKLFPTLYLSYKQDEENTFNLNYSRRINRANYYQLNPARFYLSSNSYSEGNPFLQPSFTNNFEFSHVYKNILTTTVSLSKTKNGAGQLTVHNQQEDIQLFIRRNYNNSSLISLTEYFNYKFFSWWNTNIEASTYYKEKSTKTEYLKPKYSGWGGDFSTTNNFTLNSKKTISAQVLYNYNFPSISDEYRIDAFSNLSLGFKFLLLAKQLEINILANNILRSDQMKIKSVTQGVHESFNQYYDTQYVRLAVSYKFGNKNLDANKRQTSNEDVKQRMN